jgi:hypothetical protein
MNKNTQPLEKIVLSSEFLKVNNIVKYENTNPFNEDLKVQFCYVKIIEIIDKHTIRCKTLDGKHEFETLAEKKISIIPTNSKQIEKIEELIGFKLTFIYHPTFIINLEKNPYTNSKIYNCSTVGYIYSNNLIKNHDEFYCNIKNDFLISKVFEKYPSVSKFHILNDYLIKENILLNDEQLSIVLS